MRSMFPSLGFVVISISALLPLDSLAARVESARLTLAENDVAVAGKPLRAGATVRTGETIVTGARSRADLTLPSGAVVRIGQGSRFAFTGSRLELTQGSALCRLSRKSSVVSTPSRIFAGGPAVISVHASKGYEGLFVLEGNGK